MRNNIIKTTTTKKKNKNKNKNKNKWPENSSPQKSIFFTAKKLTLQLCYIVYATNVKALALALFVILPILSTFL